MAKKNDTTAGAGTQSQLPDSKGVNTLRDAKRRKGGAGTVAAPQGGGSGKFRKSRRSPE